MSPCLAFPICGKMTAALMATAGKKGRGELLWIQAGKKLLLNKKTVQTIKAKSCFRGHWNDPRDCPSIQKGELGHCKG